MERAFAELTEEVRSRLWGKYRGLVTENKDPKRMGRVRARVPELFGDQVTPWALPAVPFAGQAHGLVLLPEEGDGVWIEFEAGDPTRPIWTGCWWGRDEMPAGAGPDTRVLATSRGHQIILDDHEDQVRLVHSGGAALTMTGQEIRVSIGSTEIILSDREIELTAGGRRITVSATGVSVNDGALEVR